MKKWMLAIGLLCSMSGAWATKYTPPPQQTTPVAAAQQQAQDQAQKQVQDQAQLQGQGQAQEAIGVGTGTGTGVGTGTGTAVNEGIQQAVRYNSEFRSLAVALPGQTAAPAVAGECLEHDRGGSGISIGVTGRTRINKECAARLHCLALADRYAAWGQLHLAVAQLAECEGVKNPELVPVAAPQPVDYVTREELERVYRSVVSK